MNLSLVGAICGPILTIYLQYQYQFWLVISSISTIVVHQIGNQDRELYHSILNLLRVIILI